MGHTGIFPQRVAPNADARTVWARVGEYQPSPWAMWRRPAGAAHADGSKRRPGPTLGMGPTIFGEKEMRPPSSSVSSVSNTASHPGHLVAEGLPGCE